MKLIKNKMILLLATTLMIITLFSLFPSVSADGTIVLENVNTQTASRQIENFLVIAQEITIPENVEKLTGVEFIFDNIIGDDLDCIVGGIKKGTAPSNPQDVESWDRSHPRSYLYNGDKINEWMNFPFTYENPELTVNEGDTYTLLIKNVRMDSLWTHVSNDVSNSNIGNMKYWNGDGWSDESNFDLRFKLYGEFGEEYNNPPTCSIDANPSSGEAPLEITFSLNADDSDGTIDSWELDVDNDGAAEYSGSGVPPSTKLHTYNNPNDYTAKLKVWDNSGAAGSDTCSVFVNQEEPEEYTLTTHTTGCGEVTPSGGTYTEGTTVTLTADPDYGWNFDHWEGEEIHGSEDSTETLFMDENKDITAVFTEEDINDPPNKPATPTGPISGLIGEDLSFTTSTTDPDGDDIFYGWDWDGDDEVDIWIGAYTSGSTVRRSHSWTNEDTYQVKVKAKDENGAESEWSESLEVTINGLEEKYLAVIICGYEEDWRAFNFPGSCSMAYSAFKNLGYNEDQIYYLSDYSDYQGVDREISNSNVDWVFNQIKSKSNQDTQLFIYACGHGDGNAIYLDSRDWSTALAAYELNTYLSDISYKNCAMLFYCCHAGSFGQKLSGQNRLIYTTTDEELDCNLNLYTGAFFDSLSKGYSYGAAWMAGDYAVSSTPVLNLYINPQIDDNGDGKTNGNIGPGPVFFDILPFPDGDGKKSLNTWPSDLHKKSLDISNEEANIEIKATNPANETNQYTVDFQATNINGNQWRWDFDNDGNWDTGNTITNGWKDREEKTTIEWQYKEYLQNNNQETNNPEEDDDTIITTNTADNIEGIKIRIITAKVQIRTDILGDRANDTTTVTIQLKDENNDDNDETEEDGEKKPIQKIIEKIKQKIQEIIEPTQPNNENTNKIIEIIDQIIEKIQQHVNANKPTTTDPNSGDETNNDEPEENTEPNPEPEPTPTTEHAYIQIKKQPAYIADEDNQYKIDFICTDWTGTEWKWDHDTDDSLGCDTLLFQTITETDIDTNGYLTYTYDYSNYIQNNNNLITTSAADDPNILQPITVTAKVIIKNQETAHEDTVTVYILPPPEQDDNNEEGGETTTNAYIHLEDSYSTNEEQDYKVTIYTPSVQGQYWRWDFNNDRVWDDTDNNPYNNWEPVDDKKVTHTYIEYQEDNSDPANSGGMVTTSGVQEETNAVYLKYVKVQVKNNLFDTEYYEDTAKVYIYT